MGIFFDYVLPVTVNRSGHLFCFLYIDSIIVYEEWIVLENMTECENFPTFFSLISLMSMRSENYR